ncbi:MAG: helix-turn-helix domain-containing protein [Prevotella sp.]|nr:helix-turn-helix domain-containing protein [Prevotella sp.]
MQANAAKGSSCPEVRIVPERLPSLNLPRSGHNIFYTNGELTVTGGHTTNFVPTPTAEYYAGGEWHQLAMAYSHDNGFAVVLGSGEVILGGGHAEPLGIGQTFMQERYQPASHTFEGFGCLDRRRVLANATQLADGRIIISGNHYAGDGIGCYDGQSHVQDLGSVRQGRSNPYVLRMGGDDAFILGGNDERDRHPDTVWVDRLKGDAVRVPLLEQWRLVYTDQPFSSDACCIGHDTYLLAATDNIGQLAVFKVCSQQGEPVISLLPTASPIPMQSQWGAIAYKGPVVVDSVRRRGYVIGVDSLYLRQYVLVIDYGQQPAGLTLCYTDPMEHAAITIPVVTPDGDLLLAGGIPGDNYKPLVDVWLYHFGTESAAVVVASRQVWLWAAVFAVLFMAFLAYIIYILGCRQTVAETELPPTAAQADAPQSDAKAAELMERISLLMDREQLYLRSDLKLQDVAVALQTNSSYVSECINSLRDQSFSQFVNTYRVHHAQELLRSQHDLKTTIVATESGFSTEASFFRNFKAVTGMTPREWLQEQLKE